MRITAALPAVALLALAACDQPKWRDTGRQDAASAPGAPAAPAPPPKAKAVPAVAGPTPAAPAWAAAQIGQRFRDLYPKTGVCKGNTDVVQQTYAGPPAGVQVHGWGWDLAGERRIERVILVDRDARIVGAGKGGVPRPDVPSNAPEIPDPNTGWNADVPLAAGALDAFGVVGEGVVCPLGHIDF